MPDDEVALMQQLHDEHAVALWRFCLRLVGPRPRRGPRTSSRRRCSAPGGTAPSSRARRRPLRAWLYTVARNIVIDEWRRQRTRRETPVAEVPERGTGDDAVDQLLLSWVVAEAITRLSPEHRAVLLECYYRGRPVAEAARRLGVPEGTVKSRTHYALRALKLALEEMGVSA